jgi:hypothetical protein
MLLCASIQEREILSKVIEMNFARAAQLKPNGVTAEFPIIFGWRKPLTYI